MQPFSYLRPADAEPASEFRYRNPVRARAGGSNGSAFTSLNPHSPYDGTGAWYGRTKKSSRR